MGCLFLPNLIIVVRADPIICGHSTEARNLAEAAIAQGFNRVNIISYPIETLEASGLPLKPIESILPYSEGITVDRPEPVGDYKVLDGRLLHGMSGRIVDLLHDAAKHNEKTYIMDLYLVPHGEVVIRAVQSCQHTAVQPNVTTIGEAVGSDITNVVKNAVESGHFGAAQLVMTNYLMHDLPVAVSQYTKDIIVSEAAKVDEVLHTHFAQRLTDRVGISYPAIDTSVYTCLADQVTAVDEVLNKRALLRDEYLLYLSRFAPAKGIEDLIDAYRLSRLYGKKRLVICGVGPHYKNLLAHAAGDPYITFFTDVSDDEKGPLMHGCSAYVFPSKPKPEFTETFGIAIAEKMLAGGLGPVITTRTGGIPEATGGESAGTCLEFPAGDVPALAQKLNDLTRMSTDDRRQMAQMAQNYAMQFDRKNVLQSLLNRADPTPASIPFVAS